MTIIDWDTARPTLAEAQRDAIDIRTVTEPICPADLTLGSDQFCAVAIICAFCDLTICPDHSDEFTTCAGNDADLHHLGCVDDCDYCVDDAREAAMWREEGF